MSFINQIASMNESGSMATPSTNPCTYDQFMDAMLNIQTHLHEAINIYARVVNEDAIASLLEDGSNVPVVTSEVEKEKLSEKLKKMWKSVIDWFFRMIDGIYDAIYEQLVLHTKNIEKHKDDIMKTTIVYEKSKQDIRDGDKVLNSYTTTIGVYEVEGYSKLIKPNFSAPYIDMSDLKKFMDGDKVDTNKLYEHYLEDCLGDKKKIDIDDINSAKMSMLDGMKSRYDELKKRKQIIIRMNTQRQNPPKDLKPEELKEMQTEVMAQVQSLRAYNKVIIEYCKTVSKILRMFIQKQEKEDN